MKNLSAEGHWIGWTGPRYMYNGTVVELTGGRGGPWVCLGFYVAFNTVRVISRRVVGRAEETSTYSSSGFCTVNCRPTASNYQLSHLRPCRESNPGLRGGRRECYHSATVAPKGGGGGGGVSDSDWLYDTGIGRKFKTFQNFRGALEELVSWPLCCYKSTYGPQDSSWKDRGIVQSAYCRGLYHLLVLACVWPYTFCVLILSDTLSCFSSIRYFTYFGSIWYFSCFNSVRFWRRCRDELIHFSKLVCRGLELCYVMRLISNCTLYLTGTQWSFFTIERYCGRGLTDNPAKWV